MTIVEALQAATQALNDAAANLLGRVNQVSQQLAATTGQATTVINNFINRPAVQTVFCDPVAGNDANDGNTPATAKKSLETIIAAMGTSATSVILLNDYTFTQRQNVYASLTINGGQVSGAPAGWTSTSRQISFLGAATNSPRSDTGSFCAGLWLLSPNIVFNNIDFALPNQVPGQNYPAHLYSSYGTSINIAVSTLTCASAAAGFLLGVAASRSSIYGSVILGTNAPGHLFQGVGAGANPNALFAYSSNITSA